jgi:fibronectin-binding autotransporter adhesin
MPSTKHPRLSGVTKLFSVLAFLFTTPVQAVDYSWIGTSNSWFTASNWTPSGQPNSASEDTATFGAGAASNPVFTINAGGGARSTGAITFDNATPYSIRLFDFDNVTRRVLTLGTGGITVLQGSHSITGDKATSGSGDLRLNSATFDVASDSTLEFDVRLVQNATSNTYTKTGAGTLIIGANNGGSGAWNFASGSGFTVSEGVLRMTANSASGNSNNSFSVSSGATLELGTAGAYGSNNGTLTLNGAGQDNLGALFASENSTINFGNGSIALASNSTIGVASSRTLTLAQNIVGAGGLTLAGGGNLLLLAENSHEGVTTISSGTLRLGDGGTTGSVSGDISIASGATLEVNRSDTISIAGNITGDGSLSKLGSGTLALSGNNSFGSGTFTLGSGTADRGYLLLTSDTALGLHDAIHLAGSQTGGVSGVQLQGGVSISQALTTAGRQNSTTTGYILRSLSGNNTWSGNVTVTGGGGSYAFISDAGSLTFAGDISSSVESNQFGARLLNFFGDGDFVVSGNLVRGGDFAMQNLSVQKDGNGTLTLAGDNNYTGSTTINAGTLVFNGTSTGSNVSVQTNGTLGGIGAITGNVTVNGTLAPGNSIGTLTVNGDLTFGNDSAFNVEIHTGTAAADRVVVNGAVVIGSDVALNLVDLGGEQPLTFGTVLTLIDYRGTGGTWNGGLFLFNSATLENSDTFTAAGNLWRIDYDDSDLITLTAIPEPSTIALLLGLAALGAGALRRRFRHG